MDPAFRYEILDTIATGDFATVYRGRDLELGREVAIKQIHPQFLADPQQLARYWQEAQLLASLRHPNILTIYDIVRPRGWLILELMQTNLRDHVAGQPIDLDLLRAVMAGSLGALGFLHSNGVIHGDVKPSNILLDARGRVVLGDFGLARRASSEEGSLLKGTTKYMAPELVAPELGAVGPASDLYSLGFSAYDLMCGEQFESLFPGLSTFGRDRQIAWMMWHAAPDRQLPPIQRVLEGVPEDLARVVERLTYKDPAGRYPSADEVLQDLRHDPAAVAAPPVDTVLADAEESVRKRRRLRLMAILAMAFSLMLSIAILLPEKKKPAPPAEPEPTRGVVHQVYPDERRLALQTAEGVPPAIKFSRHDRFLLNEKPVELRELKPDDRIVVEELRDAAGRRIQQVHAYRPVVNKGRIEEVNVELGQLVLAINEGDDEGQSQQITVQPDLDIFLNDKAAFQGQPVQLKDLQPGDRVTVHHEESQTERVATALKAYRVVSAQGVLREIDPGGSIELETGPAGNTVMQRWPTADRVEITLNGLQFVEGRLLKLSDLKAGDHAVVAHDTRVVRIDADRILQESAVISGITYQGSTSIQAVREGAGETVTYVVPASCEINLAGEPVKLAELRAGDKITVTHASFDVAAPEALKIAAQRPADPQRWAVLVGIGTYDDPGLAALPHAVGDAELLRDAFVQRYRVPQQQTLLLTDGRLIRLREELPKWLRRLGADDRVVVYYGGHAVKDADGTVYLATEQFDMKRMKETGLTLQWLIGELESCRAGDKLLLFDGAHAASQLATKRQPSSAEMLESLAPVPGRSPLSASHAIAACQAGQRNLILDASGRGLFAACLARAYSGEADRNRDVKLDPTEVLGFLAEAMPAAAQTAGAAQVARLYVPEQGRLTPEAQEAIRSLAALGAVRSPDLAAAVGRFQVAADLAGNEPEPSLIYALLLLKARQRDEAATQLQELRVTQPNLVLAPLGVAWIRFENRSYQPGIDELVAAVRAVPDPGGPEGKFPLVGQKAFYLAGQLREFALGGPPEAWRPPEDAVAQLDTAVKARGERAVAWYEQGRKRTGDILAKFDREINDPDTAPAVVARKKIERRQFSRYAAFPYNAADVLAGLNR